jgi:hypothetical protein
LGLCKAHAHCGFCCEVMHARASFLCAVVNEYMITAMATRQCTHALECVFGRLLTVLCARPCMCVPVFCFLIN